VSLDVQLKAYSDRVDSRLEQLLPAQEHPPAELHSAMRYSCLAPGKRLRPVLCMASAESVGGTAASVLDAACALEMVHCFSLIHDDLPAIDNDDLRRGRPTLHIHAGEAIAILAGDALFALAFQTLATSPHVAERILAALQCLTKASGSAGLVGGEVVDVLSEGKPVDDATLEFIHARKTGALIAASCEIGGILGGGTAEQIGALRAYGERVGLAFQIADDILNETATADQLGKSAGSDRARSKATYPSLYGIEASHAKAYEMAMGAVNALDAAKISNGLLSSLARFSIDRLS
jgi:geranylgeranyl diphosphate synthase type II